MRHTLLHLPTADVFRLVTARCAPDTSVGVLIRDHATPPEYVLLLDGVSCATLEAGLAASIRYCVQRHYPVARLAVVRQCVPR